MSVLAGIKVVELGQVLAGPFAGAILADLGATVVKVEKPDGGDDARQMGPAFRHGDALNFHEFNRGKRSVTLDLKIARGRRGAAWAAEPMPTSSCTTCAPAWRRRWASGRRPSPRGIRG